MTTYEDLIQQFNTSANALQTEIESYRLATDPGETSAKDVDIRKSFAALLEIRNKIDSCVAKFTEWNFVYRKLDAMNYHRQYDQLENWFDRVQSEKRLENKMGQRFAEMEKTIESTFGQRFAEMEQTIESAFNSHKAEVQTQFQRYRHEFPSLPEYPLVEYEKTAEKTGVAWGVFFNTFNTTSNTDPFTGTGGIERILATSVGRVNDIAGEIKFTGAYSQDTPFKDTLFLAYSVAKMEFPSAFEHKEVHLHLSPFTACATGPSVGVAMLAALVGFASGKTALASTALTGEIDLLGNLLPIGGVGIKLASAMAAKITNVIIPAKNYRDVKKIEEQLKSETDQEKRKRFDFNKLQIYPCKNFEQVKKVLFDSLSSEQLKKVAEELQREAKGGQGQ